VIAVRKHFVLQRQKRAARVDQIDAGQAILQRDFLRTQMLLYRHRKIRAAFDRRIIRDDDDFDTVHAADAGNDARAGRGSVVHAVRSERRELEKRRTWVEQRANALARQQFAALGVLGARFLAAALCRRCELRTQIIDKTTQRTCIGLKFRWDSMMGMVDLRGEVAHQSTPSEKKRPD